MFKREGEKEKLLKNKTELYIALVDRPGLIVTHANVSYCLPRKIFDPVVNSRNVRYSETSLL